MNNRPRARSLAWQAVTLSLALAVWAPWGARTASAQTAKPSEPAKVNPDAAAMAEFQSRLQKYLDLRQQLAGKLKPLSPTASAADLAARQESLAAALRTVRKSAKQGDLIMPVADMITRVVRDDFKRRSPAANQAVFEEVPERIQPVVNKILVDSATLATIPPLLLNNLPRLPDNLQYRFIGRSIVLLDGDTRLMMDYLANVLPAH